MKWISYEKWKSLSHVPLFATPWIVACQAPLHGDSQGKNTGEGCHALLQGLFPTQGSNPGLPHCRGILHQLSHKGSKPKNTGVGSLSLLQGIFPTQESNWGLLYCRRILCQLSYQGSPEKRREEERNIHLRWPAVSLAAIFFFSESRERKNYRGQKYRKPTSDWEWQ